MSPQRVILATESAALVLAVYGDVASRQGSKMPRPRAIVAILFFFGGLGWVAELGGQAARFAQAVGVAMFLTMLVGGVTGGGQAGTSLVGLIGSFTRNVTGAQPPQQGGSSQ